VTDERRAVEQALAARRAALDTTRRREHRQSMRAALDVAWASLPAALEAAWRDPATRDRWCRAAVAEARAAFVTDGPCTVEFDATAGDDVATIAHGAMGDRHCTLARVDGLGAGLRLRSGRACLDATTRGLTASRERIEAALLAAILELMDTGAGR
jgi:type II secretory pathway pseudopilin PulG